VPTSGILHVYLRMNDTLEKFDVDERKGYEQQYFEIKSFEIHFHYSKNADLVQAI
jgi:hypothetical protein